LTTELDQLETGLHLLLHRITSRFSPLWIKTIREVLIITSVCTDIVFL